MLNIITVYFFFTICISIFLLSYIIAHRYLAYVKALIMLIASLVIYIFGYMIELHSGSISEALFWNYFQYTTLAFLGSLWLIMVLFYTGKVKKLNSLPVIVLLSISLFTMIIRWTNDYHHIFYVGYEFRVVEGIGLLYIKKGWYYYIHLSISLVELIVATTILFSTYQKYKIEEGTKYIRVALISLLNIINALLLAFDPSGLGLDYTALFVPIPIILISYYIAREDYFDIGTFARTKLFNMNEDGVVIINNSGRIVDFNVRAFELFERFGMHLNVDFIMDYENLNKEFYSCFIADQENVYESQEDNMTNYYEIVTTEVLGKKQQQVGKIKKIKDVTQTKRNQKKLEHIAKTDELSQLSNRRDFLEQAELLVEEAKKTKKSVALLMIDIDHFKSINDAFGHPSGDHVISSISLRMKESFRGSDIIARIGGEEFVVLMYDVSREDSLKRAENFRKSIESSRLIKKDFDYVTTISVGVAFLDEAMALDELMEEADRLLYVAKEQGRNKVVSY